MTATRRAATSLPRCSLAVERDTLASRASSLLVSDWPPMRAANIVARAVSPTRAATSTRFAAATMANANARAASPASDYGSARAKLTGGHGQAVCWQSTRFDLAEECHEASADSRGAILNVPRAAPERANFPGHRRGRNRIRLRPATIRSGHRGDKASSVQATGRHRARPDEAVLGVCGLIYGPRSQMQCLLHSRRGALQGVQRNLRAVLSGRFSSANLGACAFLAGTVRHRSGLCCRSVSCARIEKNGLSVLRHTSFVALVVLVRRRRLMTGSSRRCPGWRDRLLAMAFFGFRFCFYGHSVYLAALTIRDGTDARGQRHRRPSLSPISRLQPSWCSSAIWSQDRVGACSPQSGQ